MITACMGSGLLFLINFLLIIQKEKRWLNNYSYQTKDNK